MPGLFDFAKKRFAPNSVNSVVAAYTALLTDDEIDVTGTYTVTLPPINSLQGTTHNQKEYKVMNSGTGTVTVQPGTNTTTNVADTIGGRNGLTSGKALWTLYPNESIVFGAQCTDTNWVIEDPFPLPALERQPWSIAVNTNASTAVNVFDANGAPTNIDITEMLVNSLDTTAANITLTGPAGTISSVVKGTIAGVITGAAALSSAAVASGSTLTVVSSSAGNARVTLIGTMQSYTY